MPDVLEPGTRKAANCYLLVRNLCVDKAYPDGMALFSGLKIRDTAPVTFMLDISLFYGLPCDTRYPEIPRVSV